MRSKSLWLGFLVLTIIITSAIGVFKIVKAVPIPRYYVNPGIVTAQPGESFNVSISVENAADLYTFGFYLRWNGAVLNVTSVTEGTFLSRYGIYETLFIPAIWNGLDPSGVDGDYINVGGSKKGQVPGESGGGVLATVTFLVEAEGESVLGLYETAHIDSRGVHVDHTVQDGYFDVTPPEFYVDPESVSDSALLVNETFTINVNISNVVDLKGFEFKLAYDKALLNATDVSIVPFLNEPTSVNKTINYGTGFVAVNVTSTGAPVSGGGPLANVTFTVITETPGNCILDLYDAKVDDEQAESFVPPFEHSPPVTDGYFSNEPMIHDMAVTLITFYPFKVTTGGQVSINVTVENEGDFSEIFSISVSYDGNLIETKSSISLEPRAQKIVTFMWDTTNVAADMYTIKAEVPQVPNETDTLDNTKTSDPVTVEEPTGGIPLEIVAAIAIVAVVAVALLVYFLKVRKPK